MSGIEIAGLVLGAVPILIPIYDVYRERTVPLFQYAETMGQFSRTLIFVQAELKTSLKTILLDGSDDEHYAELLNELNTGDWKDAQLLRKLQEKLEHSLNAYQDTVRNIYANVGILEDLVKRRVSMRRDLLVRFF